MANKDNLIKLVAQKLGPDNLKQMVDQAEQALGQDPDVTPEVIDKIIEMFEFVAENPDEYKGVMAEAIQTGAMDEGDMPPDFDPAFIAITLLAFYGLRERMGARGVAPTQMGMQQPQMAQGGLHSMAKKLQAEGRGNDTVLAHITPMEADVLRRRGGSGSINPTTGLREYGFFSFIGKAVKSVVKAVLPIAKAVLPMVANAFIPGSGILVGAALGASGGGGWKGALMGGLGGAMGPGGIGNGLASTIGGYANNVLGGAGGLSNAVLGSGILGGATSALMGKNPLMGALTAGAVSNYAPGLVDKYGASLPEGMAQSISEGAQMGANLGGGLKGAVSGGGAGALTNLAMFGLSKMGVTPSSTSTGSQNYVDPNAPVTQMANGQEVQMPTYDSTTGTYSTPSPVNPAGGLAQAAGTAVAPTAKLNMMDIAKMGLVGSLISGKTPQQAQEAITQDPELSAHQKEGMLRSLTNYKFEPNMTTFPIQGTPEYDALMSNISRGIEQKYSNPTLTEVPAKARGGRMAKQPRGALSQISRLSQGAGDGRSDSIDARLSDGEYVIDAETVALLGNGSTKAGAVVLDQMRQQIRQQKGKALAKGKFSPDAKSPLAYMKGGLR